MKVKVRTFANLKDIIGQGEVEQELIQGNTLGDLLNIMCQKYGKKFEHQIKDRSTGAMIPFLLLVNDKTFRSLVDLNVPLKDGDVVTFMLPFDGG